MPEFKDNNATRCGRLSGSIESTKSNIVLGTVNISLDARTAYALCNVLCNDQIIKHPYLERSQHDPLIKLGEAIAAFCGHSNANFKESDRNNK